jgi:hypothetical protein
LAEWQGGMSQLRTPRQIRTLRRLMAAGETWETIGRAIGMTGSSAMRAAARLGLNKSKMKGNRRRGAIAKGGNYGACTGPAIGDDGDRKRRDHERAADDLFRLSLGDWHFASRNVPPIGRITGRIDPAEGLGASSLA